MNTNELQRLVFLERARLKLTRKEMSARLSVALWILTSIEKVGYVPSMDTLKKIAIYFKKDNEWIKKIIRISLNKRKKNTSNPCVQPKYCKLNLSTLIAKITESEHEEVYLEDILYLIDLQQDNGAPLTNSSVKALLEMRIED